MNYKIGDTVVCVNASSLRGNMLVKGQHYLVTDIYECNALPCVSVALSTRCPMPCRLCGRSAWAFNPAQFQKLDGLEESATDTVARVKPREALYE